MRWRIALLLCVCGCSPTAVPGLSCEKHEECKGLADGYCARAEICTRDCSQDNFCPEHSSCSVQGKRSVCLPQCHVDEDCLSIFQCVFEVCVVKAPLAPLPQ